MEACDARKISYKDMSQMPSYSKQTFNNIIHLIFRKNAFYKMGTNSPNIEGLSKVGSNCWSIGLSLPWRDTGMRVSTPASVGTCRIK